jgi:hypothetical protein
MVVGTNIDKVYMVMDFGGMDLKVMLMLILVIFARNPSISTSICI